MSSARMVLAAFDGFPILAALLTGVALLIFSGGAAVWNGPIASGWRAGARSTLRALGSRGRLGATPRPEAWP